MLGVRKLVVYVRVRVRFGVRGGSVPLGSRGEEEKEVSIATDNKNITHTHYVCPKGIDRWW